MKSLALLFLFVTAFFSNDVLSCDEAQLQTCLKHKGGVACFFKHSCQQDKYKSQYCKNFDLDICLKFEGGKACLYNLDECRYFLEQERKQKDNRQNNSTKSLNQTKAQENSDKKNPPNSSGNNSTKCAVEKVKNCLKYKGGKGCFKKYGCDSISTKTIICSTFNFNSCLSHGGGKACYKTNSDCRSSQKNNLTQSNQTTPQESNKVNPQKKSAEQTLDRQEKKLPEQASNPKINSTDYENKDFAKSNESSSTKENSSTLSEQKSEDKSEDTTEKSPPTTPRDSGQCNSDKVIQCEKKGAKEDCYEKNFCTPLTFQKHFCENFNVSNCSQYRGGQTCKLIAKNCQIFLTKILNDPNVQNEKINQPISNTQTPKEDSKEEIKIEPEKLNLVLTQNAPTKLNDSNIQINSDNQPVAEDNKIQLDLPKTECQRRPIQVAPDTAEINNMVEQLKKINERDKALESEMLKRLKSYGHRIFPIKDLSVIVKKGSSISSRDLANNKCSALLSGTFFGGGYNPVGPFMSEDQLTIPDSKTVNRGYVAIMNDGSVDVSSMNNADYNYKNANDRQMARSLFKDHLSKVEEEKGKKIVGLLGGGALFIRQDSDGEGRAVSISDLKSRQSFDQGIGNLTAAQMRRTNHVVTFIHNGRPYAMMTASVSGQSLQRQLLEAKVQSAVKFDGGSGCAVYVSGRSGNICPSQGANPTGLCVK